MRIKSLGLWLMTLNTPQYGEARQFRGKMGEAVSEGELLFT